jgi:hypothetical protein
MKSAFRYLLLMLVAVAAFAPATASAAGPLDVLRDCSVNGTLTGSYSKSMLNAALRRIGGDLAEYSDCRSVIESALAGGPGAKASSNGGDGGGSTGGGSGDGSSGGSGSGGDAKAKHGSKGNSGVDGADDGDDGRRELASIDDDFRIEGSSGADDGGAGGVSPALLLAVIALACAALAGGVALAARHNPAFAERLRRVPLPGRRG